MYLDDGGATGIPESNWMNKAAEKLVKETPEGILVDWNEYWKTCGGSHGNWEVRHAFMELLLEKGVLSSDPDEHFLVMVQPSGWDERSWVVVPPFTRSPVEGRYVMFFTKLEYAQEWLDEWPYSQSAGCKFRITRQLSVYEKTSPPFIPEKDKIAA